MALNFFLLNRTHMHVQRRENFSSCSVQDSQKWVCASCSSPLQTFLWQPLHHQHSHCGVKIFLLRSQSVQPRHLCFFQVANIDLPHTSALPVLFLTSVWHWLWQRRNYFTISYMKQAGEAEGTTASDISSTQITALQSCISNLCPSKPFINQAGSLEFTVQHISSAALTGSAGSAEGAGMLFSAVLT